MSESKTMGQAKPGQDGESEMQSLLVRKAKLQERLQAIAADIRGGLDPDSQERALQLENRETLQEIERVTMAELESVRQQIAAAKASLPKG